MKIDLPIDNFEETIMADIVALARAMGVEASNRIIDKSPVQSGALRGSVNASINSNDESFGQMDATGEMTKQKNRSIIATAKEGDQINIVVGAPYFYGIEKGTESRAPMGIMLSTGEELEAILNVAESTKEQYK